MKNLKTKINVFLIVLLGAGSLSAPIVLASCSDSNLTAQEAIQCGTSNASGSGETPGQAGQKVNSTITDVINLLSTAIGIAAVIMILIAGFRYMTSSGDSTKVTAAKNTLLYAIIGLVIVALAQVIVRFVLDKTTAPAAPASSSSSTCPDGRPVC